MANIIVTKTVNAVEWSVDRTSYGRAMKAIKSLKKEWEKTNRAFTSNKSNPAAIYKRSAQEARLVAKRLHQTERAEQAKSTAHAIAMAKKEARAREQIAKVESARRKQAVARLTNRRTPEEQKEYNALKSKLKQMEKTGSGYGTNPEISAARQARLQQELAARKSSGSASGIVGDPNSRHDPSLVAAQNSAMERYHKSIPKEKTADEIKAEKDANKKKEREALRAERIKAAKQSTIANAAVRLRAKYGDDFRSKIKGYDDLEKRFMQSQTMRASNFRAELAAMETGLRKAKANTLSLDQGLKNLRSTLISVSAAYGAFNAAASVVKTGQFFQGMEATMLMVSDDSEEAAKRIQFVREQSYRLGLDLKTAAQGYTQMSISAKGVLSKAQNDELFKGFSEYATALQVDPVKFQRGITAIQQMMGKGQIMAEELKQQLAEGIPGSLDVFLKATQEAFNDSSIDIAKLMDMMKNGELKASKILPLVAKYYAEAARKGGALTKAQQSNRVAMQRLQQTWMNFQNQIFESGFGEALTDTFNNLAKALDSNGELARNIGQITKGFVEGFMWVFYQIYNIFIDIDGILQRYIPIFRRNGDELGKAWEWTGMAIGALFFASSLGRVFTILSKIAGLSKSLKFLKTLGGGVATPTTPSKGPWGGGGSGKGSFPFFLNPYAAATVWGLDYAVSTDSEKDDKKRQLGNAYSYGSGDFMAVVGGMLTNWWSSLWAGHMQDKANYLKSHNLMPGGSTGQTVAPMVIPTEPVSGEITIKIDAGELRNMIDQQIETANMDNINLILAVPQ
ncbi:tape measure protein [Escherichia coli]|uniref:tape measure protein n=1 Tax=Escherichia coli TaxID=562 RepID=UPI000E1D6602|nr:tape measure protein [Escherichia coli]